MSFSVVLLKVASLQKKTEQASTHGIKGATKPNQTYPAVITQHQSLLTGMKIYFTLPLFPLGISRTRHFLLVAQGKSQKRKATTWGNAQLARVGFFSALLQMLRVFESWVDAEMSAVRCVCAGSGHQWEDGLRVDVPLLVSFMRSVWQFPPLPPSLPSFSVASSPSPPAPSSCCLLWSHLVSCPRYRC